MLKDPHNHLYYSSWTHHSLSFSGIKCKAKKCNDKRNVHVKTFSFCRRFTLYGHSFCVGHWRESGQWPHHQLRHRPRDAVRCILLPQSPLPDRSFSNTGIHSKVSEPLALSPRGVDRQKRLFFAMEAFPNVIGCRGLARLITSLALLLLLIVSPLFNNCGLPAAGYVRSYYGDGRPAWYVSWLPWMFSQQTSCHR